MFTIATPKYNGSNHWFNNNGYVDSAIDNWIFEAVDGLTNTYKLKNANGKYAYAAKGLYNVTIGEDPGTNKGYWKLVTAANRDDVVNASEENPVELTHKINNPRFDDNNSGWENAPSRGGNTGGTNGNEASFDDRNPCAEHFNKTFNTYQVLTGLPNGTYEIYVQGFYREGAYAIVAPKHQAGSESLNAILYADGDNDDANVAEQALMSIFEEAGKATGGDTKTDEHIINGAFPNNMAAASYFFSAGLYWNKVKVKVTNGTLKFGVKKGTAVENDWTIFDNFRLVYLGGDLSDFENAYNTALTNAQNALTNPTYANVTGDEKSELESAISTYGTCAATKEAYTTAKNALESALNTFTSAAPNYNLYASELAVAQAISSTITVTAPTTSAEALAAFKTLKVAEYNYVKTAYPYSATSKIGEFTTWTRTGTVNGAEKNEFSPLTSQHWSGEARTYYEQPAGGWDPSGATFTANYEKVCKLPAGKYVIKVAARAASGNNTTGKVKCSAATLDAPIPNLGDSGKGITTEGVASFDEGTFANKGNGRGWVWNYLPFTLDAETEVTLTVHAEADGVMQWFSVCDGELLSMNNIATAVAYNETSSNTIEDVDVAKVTMTREIKADYNTVVLPFALTASQVASAFGAGTEVYTYSENSTDADAVTVNFTKDVSGAISANVPVLIKATTASVSQVFEGVQVVAPTADVKVAGTNFDFVGTYAPIAAIAAGDYFIGNGAVYESAGATSIKAFRAYIKGNTAGARIANFYIDGVETTAIEALEIAGEKNNGKIYNLNGQEVKNAQKGLYIINGRKVVIK